MPKELELLSDEEILKAAEQIIEEEQKLQKSNEFQPEIEEEMSEEKKKKELEMKKSQSDIEGKETGGLAPSVQGNLPDDSKGSIGDTQDEANQKKKLEKKKEEQGEESKPTQQGDSQDEANKESKSSKQGSESGEESKPTQQGSSQDTANQLGSVVNLLKKSLVEMTKLVKSQNIRIEALEKSIKPSEEKEEIRKSVQSDVIETLAKSYNKKIRSLESENEEIKKSFGSKLEELKKSQDQLAKENKEFKEKLSKPARTRETATNYDVIQKGNSDQGATLMKSKSEVLEKMEDLRKSGKISGDEVISFNASGYMTDNVKKQLGLK